VSRWFRWYRGTTENPKFRLAARNGGVTLVTVFAVWQVLLEDAANENHRGVCVKKEDFIAAALDLDDDGTVESAIRGLEYVDLISIGMGAITICDWEKWQYEQDVSDPTNAERQRRYREKKREQNADVTARNGDATARNTPDTDTDTDTERTAANAADRARAPEPEKQAAPKSAPKGGQKAACIAALSQVLSPEMADAVWQHRKTKKAELTLKAAELLAGKLTACPDATAAAELMIERGWQSVNADWVRNASATGPPAGQQQAMRFGHGGSEAKNGKARFTEALARFNERRQNGASVVIDGDCEVIDVAGRRV
jgi:hypothetical protein